MLNYQWVSNGVLELYTDSTGGANLGGGVYFEGKGLHTRNRISNFIHSSWDMHCIDISRTKDITLSDLELLIFSI
jgi:hypothetical protein